MAMRSYLSQRVPPPVKNIVRQVRQALTPPPTDERVLFDYPVVADPNPVPRLTMVIQFLNKGTDFGGAATGIDIFSRLAMLIGESASAEFRIIITDAGPETDRTIVPKWAAKAGLSVHPDQIEIVNSASNSISLRPNEVFFTQIWWNMRNFARIRDIQSELFGVSPRPLIRLAQDYEPGWWAFSSAHMLARSAYDDSAPLWSIINSGSLADYITFMGHSFERRYVFEPVIVEALRPYLDQVVSSQRQKRMLVYGRPGVDRNCFGALVRGLKTWARDYPDYKDWEILSAGEPHDPVDLGDGRRLVSIGKLPLEDYAQMLLGSSVGVSLMASPHPSYPPLEMAHFGLQTVTNTYQCKDLSGFHPNILSVRSIADDVLARAIAQACKRASDAQPASVNDVYTRTDIYPFLPQLTADLTAALTDT